MSREQIQIIGRSLILGTAKLNDLPKLGEILLKCAASAEQQPELLECVLAVIQYTLKEEDGLLFLWFWNEGLFQVIREEWPDAPEEVFWADPLYKRTD